MLDFIAYSNAQQQTAKEALSALPTSPVRPIGQVTSPRLWASARLHRLADRLEPTPSGAMSAVADCGQRPAQRLELHQRPH